MVRLDESSTKATFFGDENHLYVPKAFATEIMRLTVSGETVTRSDDLLVLADKAVDENTLLTLYRGLY